MFEREITLNQFLMDGLNDVLADVPAARIFERPPGNGHPPVWVMGHLAICSELGQSFLGGAVSHSDWLPAFGPGSSDSIESNEAYSKEDLIESIHRGYSTLCELAVAADHTAMLASHGISLLEGSKIVTVGDLIAHLLTSHFAFHLAQLSAWRRAAGHGPLF